MTVSMYAKYSPLHTEPSYYGRRKTNWKFNVFTIVLLSILATILFLFLNLPFVLENPIKGEGDHNFIRATFYATAGFYQNDSEEFVDLPKHIDINKDYYHSCKKIICYYNAPSELNSSELQPWNLRPDLCTHINVAFAHIENNTIAFNEVFNETLVRVLQLKEQNANLKVLISIGGAGQNTGFPEMVLNHANRKVFIKSVKSVLYSMKLDGIDIDWEFPALNDKFSFFERISLTPNDLFGAVDDNRQRQHFTQLLREIRMEFSREKRDYILSVAVAAPKSIVLAAYDVSEMNKYVDYVNIMTYDFHYYTMYTPLTGINSPLFETTDDLLYLTTLNVNYTAHFWLNEGMERDKLILGIPTYGHSYYLRNPDNHVIGSPSSGYGNLGNYGFVNFTEICSYLDQNPTTHLVFDNQSHAPYFYNGNEWVSYENKASVLAKAQYIKDNNFGGAMIYSLNTDDVDGRCSTSKAKYLLTEQVNNIFFNTDL